jgi:hypothetical protein
MLAATNTTRPIRYSLARPQASARRPPRSKNPPKATAQALTSYCSVVVAMRKSRWMEGSA